MKKKDKFPKFLIWRWNNDPKLNKLPEYVQYMRFDSKTHGVFVKYNGEITKFNLLSKDCPTIITGASYWTPISEQELVLLL